MKIINKTDKPDNLVKNEHILIDKCNEIEKTLPNFLYDFFIYLKNSVALSSRNAYLNDIKYFFNYLVTETNLTKAENIKDITIDEINKLKSRDINRYIGDYLIRYYVKKNDSTYIIENHNRSLSRKKSSLAVLFKFLFREELISVDITPGLNPIKLPKKHPDSIKRLTIEEVKIMLNAVETGEGLSNKEKQYWEKTKFRDRAILVLFTTYGLRLKELQMLNISSFSFTRNEFKIYRKRNKEVTMPLNNTVLKVLNEYINIERIKFNKFDDDALFLSLQSKRITERAIRELTKKYTAIALGTTKDNGFSPHKLRATAASSLLEFGFSIYDVQNILDHDNITTTQLYAKHRKNSKIDVINNYELL